MLKILFIGDIFGKLGREAVRLLLPEIKAEEQPDLVIANAENAAHGSGISLATIKELKSCGIDWFTTGDHAFDNEEQFKLCLAENLPLLRPANFSAGVPGSGAQMIDVGKNKILLINLLGRVFMHQDFDDPFRALDAILNEYLAKFKPSAIIVDMHAEATSEKAGFGHYVDGRVSAVLGTHTHVMTADAQILPGGTAFITDVGMVGATNSIIGLGKENVIKSFLTQIRQEKIIPETGEAILNSVLVTIDPKTAKATAIKPISKFLT
jgi:hypothetical protein